MRGSYCLGEPALWTCTAEGGIKWLEQPNGSSYPLGSIRYSASPHIYRYPEQWFGPIRVKVTCVRGTEYVSVARAKMESSFAGTKILCVGIDNAIGAPEATINLTVTGNVDPSIHSCSRAFGGPGKKRII